MVEPHFSQFDYNYEAQFLKKIAQGAFTSEQRHQLLQLKLLLVRRLQLEADYKRQYQEIQNRFDKQFRPNYAMRDRIITGEALPEVSYPFYKKYSIAPIEGQGKEKGIPNFWLKCIENSSQFAQMLNDNDKHVLAHLNRLTSKNGDGADYTLTFEFNPNAYFDNKELQLSYVFDKIKLTICEIRASEIKWKSNDRKATLKVKTDKGKARYAPVESFFDIFLSIHAEKPLERDPKHKDALHDLEDLGCHIKEDLIPNAIEYYLNLISEGGEANCLDPLEHYSDEDFYDLDDD